MDKNRIITSRGGYILSLCTSNNEGDSIGNEFKSNLETMVVNEDELLIIESNNLQPMNTGDSIGNEFKSNLETMVVNEDELLIIESNNLQPMNTGDSIGNEFKSNLETMVVNEDELLIIESNNLQPMNTGDSIGNEFKSNLETMVVNEDELLIIESNNLQPMNTGDSIGNEFKSNLETMVVNEDELLIIESNNLQPMNTDTSIESNLVVNEELLTSNSECNLSQLNAGTSGGTFHLLQNISGSPLMFHDTLVEDSQHADNNSLDTSSSDHDSDDHDSDFIPQTDDDDIDSSSCSTGRISVAGEQPSDNHELPNHELSNHELSNHELSNHELSNHELPNPPLQPNPENIRKCSKRGRIRTAVGEESRKRKRNPLAWVRNVRKISRVSGDEYISTTGKKKQKKLLRDPCTCRKKCYSKISQDSRQKIFTTFYKLSSPSQDQFISNSVEETHKQVERLRVADGNRKVSRRQFTRHYFLPTGEKESKLEVCQTMFLNTLDVTLGKVRIIVEKKRKSEGGICPDDGRGKHKNHKSVSSDAVNLIKKHIGMFPSYKSHYSRSHSDKKYLNPDLSISKMYRLYINFCEENNKKPENEAFYRKIFVEQFNLSFHRPSNDTCAKCDKFKMKLDTEKDESERKKVEQEYNNHMTLAENSYAEKQKNKKDSAQNSKIAFLSFDLQKCLQTPFLQSGLAFYKRSLWTFNLTVYGIANSEKQAVCFLWDETVARRGGQEIASCLRQYLLSLPKECEQVNMFSDSCSGQNRNIYVSLMILNYLDSIDVNERKIQVINQKFLEPGHTHMEADTIHASIEKVKKTTTAKIDLPKDWANLIRLVPRKPPIEVKELEQCNFLDFNKLLSSNYINRKKNTQGETVQWLKMKWIHYRKESPTKLFYKYSFNEEDQFKVVDLSRRCRHYLLNPLSPINEKVIPLPDAKLRDLHSLLDYIHPTSRQFYLNLASDATNNDEYLPDERVKMMTKKFRFQVKSFTKNGLKRYNG